MSTAQPNSSITGPLPEGMICPACAYDLRGLTSERCPECGESLAVIYRQEPLIPWEHSKELGTLRTYYTTMMQAFWRPDRFSRSVAAPICPRAAETYRRLTVVLVSGILGALALLVLLATLRQSPTVERSTVRWTIGLSWLTATLITYWLPGLFSHAFRSSKQNPIQRDRSISLSYYLWGWPLLMGLPAPALLLVLQSMVADETARALLAVLGVLLVSTTLIGTIIVFERVLRRLLHLSVWSNLGRLLLFAFLGVIQAATFTTMSWTLLYFAIIFTSFR